MTNGAMTVSLYTNYQRKQMLDFDGNELGLGCLMTRHPVNLRAYKTAVAFANVMFIGNGGGLLTIQYSTDQGKTWIDLIKMSVSKAGWIRSEFVPISKDIERLALVRCVHNDVERASVEYVAIDLLLT